MRSHISFPVVGVGASAGGVLALEGFSRGLPREPGFAVVIVTHLSPERESHLHEIVARFTAMTVQIAENGTEVRPDCVYVLPSDAILGISGGKLSITKPSPAPRRERKPIDIFLGSLARDIGEYSAAVILSGGDGDGTLGAKAVKERGGITLAQAADADGPTHPDMPRRMHAFLLLDELHPRIDKGCGDSGGMRSRILPPIGNRRTMRRFVFDADLGDSGLRFEQSHRDVADEERAQVGTMTLDGNQGTHSLSSGWRRKSL